MATLEAMWDVIQTGDLSQVQEAINLDRGLLNRRDQNNYTLLTIATHQDVKQEHIAQWLISQGAELDVQNSNGFNALILCCRYDMPATAKQLVLGGATLDLQTGNNFTALIHACRHTTPGMPEVVRLMIERGASLDLRNRWGNTALMSGCYKPHSGLPNSTEELMLECVKLCYAAGGRTDFKTTDTALDALGLSRSYNLMKHIDFLEFAVNSDLSRIVANELKLPKQLIVTLHEQGAQFIDDCEHLTEEDLKEMNCLTPIQWRRFLRRFNPSALGAGTKSENKRESNRRSQGRGKKYDAFLTHDWADDELNRNNHMRVAIVNKRLKANRLETWFDSDKLRGDIVTQIVNGIEKSRKVVVFITKRYMDKLRTETGVDYCKSEFLTAAHRVGPQNMIPVVMEPGMLDQSGWTGPLQFYIGSKLYVDFSTDAKMEENMDDLISRVRD